MDHGGETGERYKAEPCCVFIYLYVTIYAELVVQHLVALGISFHNELLTARIGISRIVDWCSDWDRGGLQLMGATDYNDSRNRDKGNPFLYLEAVLGSEPSSTSVSLWVNLLHL